MTAGTRPSTRSSAAAASQLAQPRLLVPPSTKPSTRNRSAPAAAPAVSIAAATAAVIGRRSGQSRSPLRTNSTNEWATRSSSTIPPHNGWFGTCRTSAAGRPVAATRGASQPTPRGASPRLVPAAGSSALVPPPTHSSIGPWPTVGRAGRTMSSSWTQSAPRQAWLVSRWACHVSPVARAPRPRIADAAERRATMSRSQASPGLGIGGKSPDGGLGGNRAGGMDLDMKRIGRGSEGEPRGVRHGWVEHAVSHRQARGRYPESGAVFPPALRQRAFLPFSATGAWGGAALRRQPAPSIELAEERGKERKHRAEPGRCGFSPGSVRFWLVCTP